MFELTQMMIEAVRNGDREQLEALRATVIAMFAEFFNPVDENGLPVGERAQAGGSNLAGLIIGITIAAVVGVAVAIPVINDVVAGSNATGTTKTVLDLLDLFVSLLILVAIAAPLMRRA